MKKLIVVLFIILSFCSNSFAFNYIYSGDSPNYKEKQLPESWRFIDGSSTGNFNIMPQAVHLAEGWLAVTIDNSPTFDPVIQTAGSYTYTLFAVHAEKIRTITNKPLATGKKDIGRLLKNQGINIIKEKWNLEDKSLDLLTAQEVIDMDADIATIKTYFSTLRTDIVNAVDVQAVKSVMTGAIWPTL